MQKALSYRTWPPTAAAAGAASTSLDSKNLTQNDDGSSTDGSNISAAKLVSENAVIVFGRRGCCMCHVVRQLLLGLGVNPTIFFVDEEDEAAAVDELSKIDGGSNGKLQFPAVFVGGKLFGGLERVMATHITGELVPVLREARALWL